MNRSSGGEKGAILNMATGALESLEALRMPVSLGKALGRSALSELGIVSVAWDAVELFLGFTGTLLYQGRSPSVSHPVARVL